MECRWNGKDIQYIIYSISYTGYTAGRHTHTLAAGKEATPGLRGHAAPRILVWGRGWPGKRCKEGREKLRVLRAFQVSDESRGVCRLHACVGQGLAWGNAARREGDRHYKC